MSAPRRSVAVRTAWFIAALWQLALPGAAAWADARLDAAGVTAQPHVESHTTNSCARIHPPDCALCHLLTTPAVTAPPTTLRLAVSERRDWRHGDRATPPHAQARLHPQPRAPPTLS